MIDQKTSDATLVMLTLAGRQTAYETLVLRYQRAVVASANSVVRNAYMAEDAAQDAFVSAWIKLDTLREADKYGAWVCRIAKNCAKNMLVRFREYLDLDALLAYEYERGESADDALVLSDETDSLRESVGGLSEKVRKVVELHYFEGLSIAEIADRLRVSPGTVKRQLYDGRQKIRRELCAMNEKENDTLVERVMKKVNELKLWRLHENKEGFEEAYDDVLTDVSLLPESRDKHRALADALLTGWWWLPGKRSDELFARIKEAAILGHNDEVMEAVVGVEDGKLSGKARNEFVLSKQIPFLEENGFVKSLGREWFWLGYEYFNAGDREAGFAAYEKVLAILEPSDIYYANALSAVEVEKRAAEKYAETEQGLYRVHAVAEEYRFIDGNPRMWSQPGYGRGFLQSVNADADYVIYNAARCDRYLYVAELKVGDVKTGSNGNTLSFTADGLSVETPCGSFGGCELWTTVDGRSLYKTFFKRGVGIVRQETGENGSTEVRVLKSFHIEGGDGLVPFHTGNRWVYTGVRSDIVDAEVNYHVTYADGERAVLSYYYDVARLGYDENVWEDMMLSMRCDYWTRDSEGREALSDVSRQMLRARELAKTPLERAHTESACAVMRRILDTDDALNPRRTASGHWNFFRYLELSSKNGKTTVDDDRKYSFEWKGMGSDKAGFPLFYNHMFGILQDAAGCVWDERWKDGYAESIAYKNYSHSIVTEAGCSAAGTVTTAAGTFENCLRLSLDTKGMEGGLSYRGGRMAYWFAPGVGIVRVTHNYSKDTAVATYELTEYKGVGEGYMPTDDGLVRRYDAVGLTGGFAAFAELTFAADGKGGTVVLENLCGIKTL